MTAVRRRPKTGVIEGDLFGRFDLRVRADAAGAVDLVNIRPRFVEINAAGLACAVVSALAENRDLISDCLELVSIAHEADALAAQLRSRIKTLTDSAAESSVLDGKRFCGSGQCATKTIASHSINSIDDHFDRRQVARGATEFAYVRRRDGNDK